MLLLHLAVCTFTRFAGMLQDRRNPASGTGTAATAISSTLAPGGKQMTPQRPAGTASHAKVKPSVLHTLAEQSSIELERPSHMEHYVSLLDLPASPPEDALLLKPVHHAISADAIQPQAPVNMFALPLPSPIRPRSPMFGAWADTDDVLSCVDVDAGPCDTVIEAQLNRIAQEHPARRMSM